MGQGRVRRGRKPMEGEDGHAMGGVGRGGWEAREVRVNGG